jgi:hypothetical protein
MNRKSYFWQSFTWCVAGTLVGTYFPRSNPSHRLHESIRTLLMLYPAWAHLPLIAFLFLLLFRPAVDLFRRYRQNWHTGVRFFTIIDATVVFLAGWVSAALLNGSLRKLAKKRGATTNKSVQSRFFDLSERRKITWRATGEPS